MSLTYDEALDFLFPRTTTIKFGLANTRALLKTLGNPHEVLPSIHVGGTNGKGSVSTLVAAALREAGWRVGLYTSPHLVSFRGAHPSGRRADFRGGSGHVDQPPALVHPGAEGNIL